MPEQPKGPGKLQVKRDHFSKILSKMKAIWKLRLFFFWLAGKGQLSVPD